MQALGVEVIRQYPGQVQVTRRVRVKVPGRHFPQLSTAEKKVDYWGEAVEFTERHEFGRHLQAWGDKHRGPGIRFICDSDAIDDPDHKGFWTTVGLWNKWRHATYKDDRAAEKQYLDQLPPPPTPAAAAAQPAEKDEPEIKKHFKVAYTGTHCEGQRPHGREVHPLHMVPLPEGKLLARGGREGPDQAGACRVRLRVRVRVCMCMCMCVYVGCAPSQVGTATGSLFCHMQGCQPVLCQQIRARSKNSPVIVP